MMLVGLMAHAEDRVVRVGTGDWVPYLDQNQADGGALGDVRHDDAGPGDAVELHRELVAILIDVRNGWFRRIERRMRHSLIAHPCFGCLDHSEIAERRDACVDAPWPLLCHDQLGMQ